MAVRSENEASRSGVTPTSVQLRGSRVAYSSPAWRRHSGCRSRFGSTNVIRPNRHAASASACGPRPWTYTKGRQPDIIACFGNATLDVARRSTDIIR